MKRGRIALYITSVTLVFLTIQARITEAYQLDGASIRYQVYKSKNSTFLLQFFIKEDSGDYVSTADVVTEVVLKIKDGAALSLSALDFIPLYGFFGSYYNPVDYQWVYYPYGPISEFRAEILDQPATGEYIIEVSVENGQKLSKSINFDLHLTLPVISSRTFQIQMDPDGDIYWTWDIPSQLLALAKSYDLEFRAGVSALANEQVTAIFWPTVPVYMGFCIVPGYIYQNLSSTADEIRFAVFARTSNNNSQSNSNSIVVRDFITPVSVTPKKNATVIPFF